MRLNEDDYEFDNDDYEFDDDYEEEVKGKKPSRKERKEEQAPKRAETNFDMSEKRQKNTNKITPITKNKRQGQQANVLLLVLDGKTIQEKSRFFSNISKANRDRLMRIAGLKVKK